MSDIFFSRPTIDSSESKSVLSISPVGLPIASRITNSKFTSGNITVTGPSGSELVGVFLQEK